VESHGTHLPRHTEGEGVGEDSATSVLARAHTLSARAARSADGAERARRLDGALVADTRDAGLFALCVPRELGGLQAAPAVLLDAVEEMAAGDGAAGWCLAVHATSGMLAAYLPKLDARTVFGSRSVVGGVFAPRGRAIHLPGGRLRVTGRWPFASGVEHCDWLMGGCLVSEGDAVRRRPGGQPDVRMVVFPRSSVEVIDTWSVSGMRATGSHDMTVSDVEVGAGRSASLFTDRPWCADALYAFPLFGLLSLAIAVSTLGIARSAVSDVIALAAGKRAVGSQRSLAQRSTTQVAVAEAEATRRAARALLYEVTDRAWEAASEHGAVSVALRADLRLAATHATRAAVTTVDQMYRLGGTSSLYESSPLQRRFRDVHVAGAHALVAPATDELTGRLLLGLDTDVSQL